MSEAILREGSNPFGDHDGRTSVDFGAHGHVGVTLSGWLNKTVLTRVGNEHRGSGGEIGLDAPMDELLLENPD